jgi:flagellar motility protein MotE (MotC chaperone)
MTDILAPSRLLPATILMTTVALGIKVFALVTAAPSPGEWQAWKGQMLELASIVRMIGQAHAASPQATGTHSVSVPPQANGATPEMPAELQPISQPAPTPQATAPQATTPQATTPLTRTPPVVTASTASSQAQAPTSADAAQPVSLQRGQVEEREQLLADREATLAATDKHLTDRVAELQAIQTRLETLESERKVQEEANWAGLVKLYEGMRPRDAAVIFNALDKHVLLEILDRMKPAKAASVLALMDPEGARQITTDLAEKRTRSTTIAN